MEFHVSIAGAMPDLDLVGDAVRSIDASAVVDIDADGRLLRVAAAIDTAELIGLLDGVGYPVAARQVRRLPSICCGGCSG